MLLAEKTLDISARRVYGKTLNYDLYHIFSSFSLD